MTALFINKIGDLFFMLAIVLAIGLFSDLSLSTIFSLIPHLNPDLIFILSICFIGAAAAKSALIPLHTWLPYAKEGWLPKAILGKKKEKRQGGKKNKPKRAYSTYTKEKIETSIKLPKSVIQNQLKQKLNIQECENHNIKSLKNVSPQFLQWLVGFVDGEGSFKISISKNYVTYKFQIKLHIDDISILKFIQSQLNAGTIIIEKNQARYRISKKEDIKTKIIPIFTKYPLQGTKSLNFRDFKLAKECGNIEKIKLIKKQMNNSRKDYSTYPISVIKLNIFYIQGFIEGEGSFVSKGKIRFKIGQHKDNALLIEAILDYLINLSINLKQNSYPKKEQFYIDKVLPMCYLAIRDTTILADFIVPLFILIRKYFLTRKLTDFDRWCIVVIMNRYGLNKTAKEKEILNRIAENTNNRRLSTYKGPKLLPLPTQKEIDEIFNQPIKLDLNLSHYENTQNLQRVRIKVIDLNNNEIDNSPFISQDVAAKYLGIPNTTFRRYVKSGKCWNNSYYFIKF